VVNLSGYAYNILKTVSEKGYQLLTKKRKCTPEKILATPMTPCAMLK